MEPSRKLLVFLLVGAVVANAQYYDQTTPVPILKQINRHNDDGSYSYGYEAADGSYKIETKHPTGEVLGKYGYVDDTGAAREVEYGASRRGFEPAGTDINVAPPTLNSNNNYYKGNAVGGEDYDDGQYHEDPSVYYKNPSYNSSPRKVFNNPPPQQNYNTQPSNNFNYNSRPSYNSNYNSYNAEPSYNNYNSHHQSYNPPQQQYFPKVDPNQFRGHPATNFDVYSGSYSVNYSGRR